MPKPPTPQELAYTEAIKCQAVTEKRQFIASDGSVHDSWQSAHQASCRAAVVTYIGALKESLPGSVHEVDWVFHVDVHFIALLKDAGVELP